jgi:hypothetical protein
MKIPPTNTEPRPAPDVNKPTTKRNTSGSEAVVDEPGEANAAGRDFASVLEDVARPRERGQQEGDGEGERFDSQTRERPEGETEASRREERHGSDDEGGEQRGGSFDQRGGGVREVSTSQDAASARSILHIADLERIISAVRTQRLAGGVREVTLELRRSVLDGLRVKLSLDGAGRVAAEFIASSERVRAQLDARSPELAEILRSRGVNLASMRTSMDANTSGQDSQGSAQSYLAQSGASSVSGLTSGAAPADDIDSVDAGAESDSTTYRA